jgi:rRNA maturation endonuclease Nob1
MIRYGGMGRIKDLFRSTSSDRNQYSQVKYYCTSCGKEHNDVACPSCGSEMKKVG